MKRALPPLWCLTPLLSLILACISIGLGQSVPPSVRVWSVGPLTGPQRVASIVLGAEAGKITAPQVDSQTGSIFAATRSVVFAGDRIILASMVGLRRVEGASIPEGVYELLSLDVRTGEVKDRREVSAFGSLKVFATNDGHVVTSGRKLMRLTPDLKDAGSFDNSGNERNSWRVENISPDGSMLGNATSPGFELIDARTLQSVRLSDLPITETSLSSKAVVSDSPWWITDYPNAKSFITLTDEKGAHLIFHGDCGGRPQFLRDDRILTATCKVARILDTQGNILRTITLHDPVAFAGVSQNGKRFALQVGRREHFVIYSTETSEPVAQITPDEQPQAQFWTAFSPDGGMIVVGSPLKLTLYRLPECSR
jgi:hypothetical protein